MLSCSHQTLANYERRGDLSVHFAYRHDGRGAEHRVIVYDPHELKKLAIKLRRHITTHPRDSGELAARAFELFDEGRAEREVVRELRVDPDTVRELKEKWSNMGGADLVLNPTAKEVLEKVLGPFDTVTEMVERVVAQLSPTTTGITPSA